MRIFTLMILLLSFGLMNSLHAVTYKWINDDGNVVYSQQPPEDERQYQRLKDNRKYGTTPVETTEEETSASSAGSEGTKETGYSEEDIARRAAMKEKNCQAAKEALDLYTVHKRFKQEDGTVTTLNEEQRQANIKKAEAAVEEFCN